MRRLGYLLPTVALLVACQKPLPVPEAVLPVAPAAGAVLRSAAVRVAWTPSDDARYRLQLATDSKFATLLLDTTLAPDSVVITLTVDGRYYWRVRPVSSDSVWGDWSVTSVFSLERFHIVASARTQGYPHDIAIQGDRAYIADGQAGLVIFDVSDPLQPAIIGSKMDSLNEAWGVAVRDSYTYLAYGYKELLILKTVRPDSITTVGVLEYPQPGYGYDLALTDTFLYIAADAQFIKVGIADPRYPNLVYQGYYPRDCRGVAVSGANAFLAVGQLGLATWRIDTVPPVQAGSADTRGLARGIAVAQNHVFVADGREGLAVFDCSSPAAPVEVGNLPLVGYANTIALHDTLAFVACGDGGISIVNVVRPEAPWLVARIATGYAMGVCPVGQYVYAGDRDLGLVVIKQEE